jgi:tetratricopeptide (TPR) repeat protein
VGAVPKNVAGEPDLSIEHFKRSIRLSPRDRLGAHELTFGAAHFFKRQYGDAAAILLASLQEAPGFALTHRFLAVCYAHTGRLDEARDIVARLKMITPVVVPSIVPHRNPEHCELLLSGLRLAAGEAG